MVHLGLLGVFLFLAVVSLSLHSSAFQSIASHHVFEDALPVLPIEKSETSQLFEFLPHNQEPKGQKRCKNKDKFADMFKLLQRLQQIDEDSNSNLESDEFNVIPALNHDEEIHDKIPFNNVDVLYPRYHNKRNGKGQTKWVIVLQLPAPASSKCKKAVSELIEFTRGAFESMARHDVCSRPNLTPFDLNFKIKTTKQKYSDNTPVSNFFKKDLPYLEEESTTRTYPGNSLLDEKRSGQDNENDSKVNVSFSGTEPKIVFDKILGNISENQEPIDSSTMSIFKKNSISNVEVVPHYPGKHLNNIKATLDVQSFHNPLLESKTKTHKNIHDENENYKDDFLFEHKPYSQNNMLSILQNRFENEENARKLKSKPSYSGLHDYDTIDNVKYITAHEPYFVDDFKKPVQNVQSDVLSISQNNKDYDDVISDDFQSSPVSDLESFKPIKNFNFDKIVQLQDNPSDFFKNKAPLTIEVTPGPQSKNPYILDSLSSEYKVVTDLPTHKFFDHNNEINPKIKNKKQSPFNELNYNFKVNEYPNYYHNYVTSQLGQNDNNKQFDLNHKHNGLYGSNSHIFKDGAQFKDKYGIRLDVLPETYEHNILPLKNQLGKFETFSHQIEVPATVPYQGNNVQTNYHSFDNFAPGNDGYQTEFQIHDETNPYKVIATPNQDGEIELTYLLRKPKPVVEIPTYYVKYRIPYQNYILNLMKQEKLKMSPKEFHKELLSSSRPIDFSPGLRMYPTNEIQNLVASNGNLITAAVKEKNSTKKVINLKHVKDLRTLLAKLTDHEIDLPDISFGALENEKRDSSVKGVISNLLNNGYPEMNESSINEYWEQISNITDEYPEKHESDITQNSEIL